MTNTERNETAATVASRSATVAPKKTSSKQATRRTKRAPTRARTAQRRQPAKPGNKPARRATGRAQSKGARILELIVRGKGATLAEIMTATEMVYFRRRRLQPDPGLGPFVRKLSQTDPLEGGAEV